MPVRRRTPQAWEPIRGIMDPIVGGADCCAGPNHSGLDRQGLGAIEHNLLWRVAIVMATTKARSTNWRELLSKLVQNFWFFPETETCTLLPSSGLTGEDV